MKSELAARHNQYAWLVAWPVILLLVMSSCARSCSADHSAADTDVLDAVRVTGEKAVTAYVGASASNPAAAEAIYGPLVAPPPKAAFPYPGEDVISSTAGTPKRATTRPDQSQVWRVPVQVLTANGEQTWQQYITVTADGQYQVNGLPGHIPGISQVAPAGAETEDHGLTSVGPDSKIYAAVQDFLTAWLVGDGDLSRFASDSIPAFPSPPYGGEIVIESLSASKTPDKPEGSITVSVTITATKVAKEEISYNLSLTGSDGRWIVTDYQAAPPAAA